MKNWTRPEISSISIECTEVFKDNNKIERPTPYDAIDVVIVRSEASSHLVIPS